MLSPLGTPFLHPPRSVTDGISDFPNLPRALHVMLFLCAHEVTLLTLPVAPGQPLLSREAFPKHQPTAWSAAALGSWALDLSVDITICFWAWVSSTESRPRVPGRECDRASLYLLCPWWGGRQSAMLLPHPGHRPCKEQGAAERGRSGAGP